jgi:PAS domain S-box-containing protein
MATLIYYGKLLTGQHMRTLSTALSPKKILGLVLLIIFVAEVIVMFTLPLVVSPRVNEGVRALIDSTLLTLLTAPVLWWIIIGPLRRLAIAERARAASIVEAAADGIVTTNNRGEIESFNVAAEHIFGYPADEIIGSGFGSLLVSSDKDQTSGDLISGMMERSGRTNSEGYEIEGLRKSGEAFPMRLAVSEVYLEDGRVFTTIIRDLTEQKKAQLQQREHDIARAEQMAVVAQLATGVAHELRNPLTSIKLLVQNNQEELISRGVPDGDLTVIEREILRMERSLQAFLEFARPTKSTHRHFRVAELVDQVFLLVESRAFQQSVVCVKTGDPDQALEVEADRDKVQQLLLNLVLNALDAMPKGGTLEIQLGGVHDGQQELKVIDSGPGIDQKVMTHLFEPFVTTKETGVGIGLAISHRIAQESKGSLVAYNRPEGGACFVLRLPLSSN